MYSVFGLPAGETLHPSLFHVGHHDEILEVNSVDLRTQKVLETYEAEEYTYNQEVPDRNRNAGAEMNVPRHVLP